MADTRDPVDRHVGQRLRLLRGLMGLSQEKLAQLAGVSFQQIQKYEQGTNRIGSGRLYRLSRVLGVQVGYFFEGLDAAFDGVPAARQAAGEGLAEEGASFVHDAPSPEPAPRIFDRRESLEMLRAFNRIEEPLVRRRLFELAKALAGVRYRGQREPGSG